MSTGLPTPEEVRAALDARADWRTHTDLPPVFLAIGERLEVLLNAYLDEPTMIDPDDVRALQYQLAVTAQWRAERYGSDRFAERRRMLLALLERIRRNLLPQIASKTAVIPVTDGPSRAAIDGVRSAFMSTLTATNDYTGQRLRKARERRGLSKRELAKRAGVQTAQVRLWERGDHVPTAANLLKLLPHIGGTLDDYLSE